MSDLLQRKVNAIKEKIDKLDAEIEHMEKESTAGLLSPIERMRLTSLKQEKNDLKVKMKELLL